MQRDKKGAICNYSFVFNRIYKFLLRRASCFLPEFDLSKVIRINGTCSPLGEATDTAADLGVEVETLDVKILSDFVVGHNSIYINFIWVLLTGFLVMFMQAGFALVETGFCRL